MIIEAVETYMTESSGLTCRFKETDPKECIVYLDSTQEIDMDEENGQRVYRVSGAVFVITRNDGGCTNNEMTLLTLMGKVKAEWDDTIEVSRDGTHLKYSLGYKNINVFEKKCSNEDGTIKEVYYEILPIS